MRRQRPKYCMLWPQLARRGASAVPAIIEAPQRPMPKPYTRPPTPWDKSARGTGKRSRAAKALDVGKQLVRVTAVWAILEDRPASDEMLKQPCPY